MRRIGEVYQRAKKVEGSDTTMCHNKVSLPGQDNYKLKRKVLSILFPASATFLFL